MKSLFLSLLLITSSLVQAQDADVSATVDRNQIGLGDVINFTIRITAHDGGQADEPRISGLDGFDLINTSSGSETRSTFENGRFQTEQSRVYTYMLAANRKGTLTIPAIPVQVGTKVYRTEPIQIAVSAERRPQPRGQPQNDDSFDQMDQMEELFNQMLQRRLRPNAPPGGGGQMGIPPSGPVNPDEAFFVQAVTDKNKAYVGEAIVTNFYLYTRGQIRDIDTLKYPDLKGFWKEDLEVATRLNFEPIVVNGISYQRALLVSYALFPIKAGKATVDPYKAKCTVITASNFGFGKPAIVTKSSKSIDIEVVNVPSEGRPSQFTGAVGQFRMNAQFEPTSGVVNQPVTLRVKVEGRGNAKLIELPKLELPKSFEIYDQKSQAKYLKDGSSFKEFEVLIIPREAGIFEIPAIAIAAFDPAAKKFGQVSSQPLKLNVLGSGQNPTQVPPQAASSGTGAPPAPAQAEGSGLPPLATDLNGSFVSAKVAPTFTIALYLAILAFLGQQSWVKFRRKPKRATLSQTLKRRLSRVREHRSQKQWRLMGVEATNTIYYILGQLSDQGGASQDLEKLLELTPPSLRSELAKPLRELLASFEALSFAPEKLVAEMTEKGQIQKLLEQLEKTLARAIELSEI